MLRSILRLTVFACAVGVVKMFAPLSPLTHPMKEQGSSSLRVSTQEREEQSHNADLYGITRGPFHDRHDTHHHLIDVDKDKLDDLGDKSVQVHEMELDPVTITALCFAAIAINFMVFAHWGDAGLGGLVASISNYMRQ